MKKILVNFLVFVLLLSFVFQSSSASAISVTRVNESEPEALSDFKIQLNPEVPETPEQHENLEPIFHPEPYLPEHRFDLEDRYTEMLLDPDLPEEIRSHLMEGLEPAEKNEYVSTTPEQIAQTKAQEESFDCSLVTDVPQIECEALVALYNETNTGYSFWRNDENWLSELSVGTWYGVTTTDGHVTSLLLGNNIYGHYGGIPSELGNLSYLLDLDFSLNDLNYQPELSNLTQLRLLNLSGNYFYAFDFDRLSTLTNLQSLNLSDSQPIGAFPQELLNLVSLVSINLSDTGIQGNIPPELGNLFNLRSLDLSSNQIQGSIPNEISNLINLEYLNLSSNQLSGTLPDEMGNLIQLEHLDLYYNNISGSIPLTFTNLTSLILLNFLKTGICEPNTTDFLLWKSSVTTWSASGIGCEGPEFSCSLVTDIPLLECEALVALYDYTNGSGWWDSTGWLEGTMAANWHMVSTSDGHVSDLLLPNNQLTGSIPSKLGDLTYLQSLDLGNETSEERIFNRITGSIPVELGLLSKLLELRLDDNLLSGNIPHELGNLANLTFLDISGNELTDSIPPELGNLVNLEWLNLSNNRLSGPIPPELGSLTNLRYLVLYYNGLSENLPAELGNLSNLTQLDLFQNGISGSIPLSFVNLTKLRMFNFFETGLCEPTTPEFLAWKETVLYWSGTGIICEIDDPEGDWLIMYYLVGDNDGYQNVYVLHNYLTGIRNANIDLAIYWDRKYFDTEYLYRFGSGDQTKENFENLDSDDPQTLIDFVNWATSKTNKAHTALVLVDHGNALAGFGWDEGSNSFDYLSHKDLGFVFQNTTPIDVLFMEACTMANLEPVWEFREHVKYYVGHEGITHLFPYSHSYIKNIPASFSASQIAYNIADSHFRFYDSINFASTVSVLDLQRLDELVANLSQLSYSMLTASDTVKDAVWTKMISPDLYRVPISQKKQVVDLLQFVNSIMNIPELNTYANSVVESILDLVRYNGQVSTIFENNENANGVSVALPVEKTSFYSGELFNFASSADWSQTNNTLSQDLSSYDPTINYWGLFVSTYVLDNNPESEDSPEPPPLLPLETLGVLYLPIIITTD